jgi:hypothetical protein
VVSDLLRGRPIWFGGDDRSEASMAQFLSNANVVFNHCGKGSIGSGAGVSFREKIGRLQ